MWSINRKEGHYFDSEQDKFKRPENFEENGYGLDVDLLIILH